MYNLKDALLLFRSVKDPFQRGFSLKVVTIIVVSVYFMALLSSFDEFYLAKYMPYPKEQGHWHCDVTASSFLWLILSIKNGLIIFGLPLPILIMLHIVSFRAIVHSSQQFQLDANRIRTIKRVRKTFCTIILVFFVLIVPAGTYFVVFSCIKYIKPSIVNEHLYTLARFFNILVSLNSCGNPLIYSKIYRRCSWCRSCMRSQSTHGRHTGATIQANEIELR